MPHRQRARLASRHPIHVTLTVREGLPSLCSFELGALVKQVLAEGAQRPGFRLVHYTILGNHLHLIVETKDRDSLSKAMQGLSIRLAKRINKALGRRGSVFEGRYHEHVLRTPRETRAALNYVLNNARRHTRQGTTATQPDPLPADAADPLSTAPFFDGWRETPRNRPVGRPCPCPPAKTWLLQKGWRRHGLLDLTAVPGR